MRFLVLTLVLFLTCSLPAYAGARGEVIPGPITGQVLDIHDGDTVTVRLHVWMGQNVETAVRIDGIDTPEIHGKCEKEKEMAQTARTEIVNLLADGKIMLYNIKFGKYAGRVLAQVKATDGTDIAQYMIDKGLARPYHGEKRNGWCS